MEQDETWLNKASLVISREDSASFLSCWAAGAWSWGALWSYTQTLGVDLHHEKYAGAFNKLLFKNDHDLRWFSESADNGKDYVN